MQISRKQFILITILFLLLPVSANYRLIFFGEKTTGIVTELKQDRGNPEIYYSIIHFEADGQYIDFIGPENLKYPPGKEITIYYKPGKPQKFIMFNIAGLLLNNKMITPGVLLIVWFAFYFSIRESQIRNPKASNLHRYRKAIEQQNKAIRH